MPPEIGCRVRLGLAAISFETVRRRLTITAEFSDSEGAGITRRVDSAYAVAAMLLLTAPRTASCWWVSRACRASA